MKDYRKHYGQAVPALHGKAIEFVINRIKDISKNNASCVFIEGFRTITDRDTTLIDIYAEKNGINSSFIDKGRLTCSNREACECKEIKGERKPDLIYLNLEEPSRNFEQISESIKKDSDNCKGAFLVIASVKENNLSREEYEKLGFEFISTLSDKDNTLFVNTLRYEGEKNQSKKNNKKDAPLYSEENFNNDISE